MSAENRWTEEWWVEEKIKVLDNDIRGKKILKPGPDTSQAACIGMPTDIFFPKTEEAQTQTEKDQAKAQENQAKAICADCPIKKLCEIYAMEHNEYGIRGGTTKKQRQRRRSTLGSRVNRLRANREK